MIEVLIALFITMIGVMALISMQPQAWLLAGRSDFLGRASQILHEEFEINEVNIMNPRNANAPWGTALPTVLNASINNTRAVTISGAGQRGDLTFTVNTTITNIGTNIWRVTIRVTWPGNNTGVSESLIVTRQEFFRFPPGA
jgi:Tfp pilus assembly protein PilV